MRISITQVRRAVPALTPPTARAYILRLMDSTYADIEAFFARTFGDHGRTRIIRSPGRVNLIGEHTDYNDGLVFPMAIEPQVNFVCRAREDAVIRVASTVFPDQIVDFRIDQPIQRGEPSWANYIRGVAAQLKQAGIPLTGIDMALANTLPVGGGLSSSAAIEVGTALCLLTLAGHQMDVSRLALICQKAEHEYALVPCGIMDQMIVSSAKEGHATLYDCRSGHKQFIPIDPRELRVVIANSMVKHELSGGEYAERRRQCEQAVAHFQKTKPDVKALRDITPQQVQQAKDQLGDVVHRRARHVVTEIQRTSDAAAALSARQYEKAGELMVQSHNSLRDDYEVSVPELDFLVEQAMATKGVYGARMTGGGFGGCIVALVQPRRVDALLEHLDRTYQQQFGQKPVSFVTTASAAASVVG